MRKPTSGCTSVQSDQGLHSTLTESLDTTECINGEQMHVSVLGMNLNLCILHMLKDTFSLVVAHIFGKLKIDCVGV